MVADSFIAEKHELYRACRSTGNLISRHQLYPCVPGREMSGLCSVHIALLLCRRVAIATGDRHTL
jgi:hypothetical protein